MKFLKTVNRERHFFHKSLSISFLFQGFISKLIAKFMGFVRNFTWASLQFQKLLTVLSVLPSQWPLSKTYTLNIHRDKPGPWQTTLARTKGHWFHIQLCRWKELGLHHVAGYDGTSVTHIEGNIVGGYVFCSRHRSTNSCDCVTSQLNPNKWHCSHLDHCLFCIWRRSPHWGFSLQATMAEGCHMGKQARNFQKPEAAFSSDDSTKPNHRHSTSGDREETTQ